MGIPVLLTGMHLKSIRLAPKEAIVHFLMLSILVALLIYTRFVNLSWSLPYPMHPDERNMVDAISQLHCTYPSDALKIVGRLIWEKDAIYHGSSLTTFLGHAPCLAPTFFAYGQATLYAGLVVSHLITGPRTIPKIPLNYTDIALSLRLISATASVLTAIVLYKLIEIMHGKKLSHFSIYTSLAGLIFVPSAIQFAHYGTTESVLALFYVSVVYLSVHLYSSPKITFTSLIILAVLSGLAIGAKLSGLITLGVPLFVVGLRWVQESERLYRVRRAALAAYGDESVDHPTPSYLNVITLRHCIHAKLSTFSHMCILIVVTAFVAILSSPYNIISYTEFANSMMYESGVGVGSVVPFYTRQFLLEKPIIFQLVHVLPYALGTMMTVLGLLGFVFLRVRSGSYTIVRFAIVLAFVANGFLYAKWTRFLAPTLPLITLFAVLTWLRLVDRTHTLSMHRRRIASYGLGILLCVMIVPGIAFVQVYTNRDVRLAASAWMYDHVPSGSTVLSETANVIDVPIDGAGVVRPPGYNITNISFNFYDLDDSPALQADLKRHIKEADYISIPSRRIFYNHSCRPTGKVVDPDIDPRPLHTPEKCAFLRAKYPLLNRYYDDLFGGKLGFAPVARFASYPRLKFFGYTFIEFPDEIAEETSTVFDHPVMRIYVKVDANKK